MQREMDCVNRHLQEGKMSWQDVCYTGSSKDGGRRRVINEQMNQIEEQGQQVSDTQRQPALGDQTGQTPSAEKQPTEISQETPKKRYSLAPARVHTFDIGVDPYYNRYNEHDTGVFLTGAMVGYYGNYAFRPPKGNVLNNEILDFYSLQGHYAQGKLDYKGSGTDNGYPNKMFEVRGLVGKDFDFTDSSRVTGYFGYGYRFLQDNSQGQMTSTGAWGYHRRSHYFYIPIGATADIPTGKDTQVSLNLEYDYFIQGYQKSCLSDGNHFTTHGLSTDVKNHQDNGFGLRGSVRFLKHYPQLDVYFEPFIRFWNIEDSKVEDTIIDGKFSSGLEPHNTTVETGSKFGVQF